MKTFFAACAAAFIGTQASATTYDFNDQTLPSIFDSASGFGFRTESGNPSNAALSFTGGGSTVGTTPAGVNTLHTGGQLRHATTGALNLSSTASISFDFLFGTSGSTPYGSFENADGSEDFIVAYSVDGGSTFAEFFRIDTEDNTYHGDLATAVVALPGAAQTGSTLLSFLQVRNSGSAYDHWALDNVTLSVAAVPLPAGLPLLLTALGGAALLRNRRKQKAA
ncbi:hypothetical protein RSK20926_11949 [Roseobacter sp. SK209-2-6]|uniref:VPLPA-CTERM sorting domain-containing protein n=1 Tax=Roseobacter sp. SK209-2-6 TaxID=388739 RepID=UPI0000F3C73E|nr:VPLPA-CTERM sorting domain-containing protein [Roseobacter sp. SK209-2-6]EBA18431.1 hypothetical protein RSK20926_11949 [Roseobacter sp. SK209-2-6]